MRSTQFQLRNTPKSNDLGAMSCNGSAGLYFLSPGTTTNDKKYLKLIKDKPKIHQCRIFMHDGVPHHRSRIVADFSKIQKVEVLQWSGNSPDLPYSKSVENS